MAVELLALSKFKMQLLALVSETRELRERERSAREELHISNQRQKQTEAEYAQKLRKLRAQLASRDESQHKLETKLKFLENVNALLEKKEKELKETIDNLLQSRETFLSLYEDSMCALKRSIEVRDQKVAVLSEKIQAHLLLLDSIAKEAAAVKQVVDNVQHLVNERELVGMYSLDAITSVQVTGLKGKMSKISVFEKEFVEKIHFLEDKLTDYQHEIRKRDIAISELKEHLEAEKITSYVQPEVEELRKSLLVKEEVIQSLTSEKQALLLELKHVEVMHTKIQDIVIKLNAEDQKVTSILEGQEVCEMVSQDKNESSENIIQVIENTSPKGISGRGAIQKTDKSPHQEQKIVTETFCEKRAPYPCLFQPSVHSLQSVSLDPPSTSVLHITTDGNMDQCMSLVHHISSEISASGAETMEGASP